MSNRIAHLLTCVAACLPLISCGGGGGDAPPRLSTNTVPGAPLNVTINTGDSALGLGWNPPANNGGTAIQSYNVSVAPAVSAANIIVSGTRALIRNVSNGINYQITVTATNGAGTGPSSVAATATPHANPTSAYTPIVIQGDNSPSGIYDPSILRASNGDLWMSYSSVDYHNNAGSQLVQDVGIRVARSVDGGISFNFVTTVASPTDTIVTDSSLSACGTATCAGRWAYETSWLVEDSSDPDPTRRFKLFAHKYFLYPGGAATTLYHLGAIVMWTSSSPNAAWSAATSLLGWNLTPPELTPLRNVNVIDPALADCIVVAEGSAAVRGGVIDFVFACPNGSGNPLPQKIVMLRSSDHANTFQYVSTLLTPTDAAPLTANFFTAPALIAASNSAPVLLVTPTFNGIYSGCIVFPIADDTAGSLFRVNGVAAGISYTLPIATHFGGACTYDNALGQRGVLQSDATPAANLVNTRFNVIATHNAVQN